MVQVLKKSVDFVSVHKRIIMILGLFLLTFVVVPQVVEAQSALKLAVCPMLNRKRKKVLIRFLISQSMY